LRSASKIGPRGEEVDQEILLDLVNEDAVRSIVEAIPNIDLSPSPPPPPEEPAPGAETQSTQVFSSM
jgi:hypothetical protein